MLPPDRSRETSPLFRNSPSLYRNQSPAFRSGSPSSTSSVSSYVNPGYKNCKFLDDSTYPLTYSYFFYYFNFPTFFFVKFIMFFGINHLILIVKHLYNLLYKNKPPYVFFYLCACQISAFL